MYKARSTQQSFAASKSSWAQIPTHMLHFPSIGSLGQARAYSSDGQNGTKSEFGFQSLGSLFPAPPAPGRYSRPKERRAEEAAVKESDEPVSSVEAQKLSAMDVDKSFFQSTSPPNTTESSLYEGSAIQARPNVSPDFADSVSADPSKPLVRRLSTKDISPEVPGTESDKLRKITVTRRRERASARKPREPSKARASQPVQAKREIPNPFATTKPRNGSSHEAATGTKPSTKAWGLSQQDQDTLDSITDPSTTRPVAEPQKIRGPLDTVRSDPTPDSSRRLTHVKASGEAHMVDVGAKTSTKRTAIAIAQVVLNKVAYEQIAENNNKKGDVLGIARIAGIMAAKRTSDIIPLCHPLAISKAEVDVHLMSTGSGKGYWPANQRFVAIQARVDCVGPTGVEMEAMTAVQGAALTIVDMCKAVDKYLRIDGAKVVYKAGGRSGLSVDLKWRREVGEDKFLESGELREDAHSVPRSIVRP